MANEFTVGPKGISEFLENTKYFTNNNIIPYSSFGFNEKNEKKIP